VLAADSNTAGTPPDDGLDPSEPIEGWTQFDRDAAARIIYVSRSVGDDANHGLSPVAPVKTIRKGKALLRDGHADWMLLRRGDAFMQQAMDMRKGTWDSAFTAQDVVPSMQAGFERQSAP